VGREGVKGKLVREEEMGDEGEDQENERGNEREVVMPCSLVLAAVGWILAGSKGGRDFASIDWTLFTVVKSIAT